MTIASKRNIQLTFKKYKIKPSKRLGQNFLVDKSALKKIIEAAALKPSDLVLEIGPGLGALTLALAQKAKKVLAVEKDQKMCEILKKALKDYKNTAIINKDILKISNFQYASKQIQNSKFKIQNSYKVVANLPYYITSPVIRKFLEAKNPPQLMVLTVQKEVAQRICSQPPKMNLLAVSVQFLAKPKIIAYVSRKAFWPAPKVDSAILQITPLPKAGKKPVKIILFFKIVKAGFAQPRKQLLNNLSAKLKIDKNKTRAWLLKNNLRASQRAENLTLQDWQNLAKTCQEFFTLDTDC